MISAQEITSDRKHDTKRLQSISSVPLTKLNTLLWPWKHILKDPISLKTTCRI
jgi:hypothetical protein